MDGQVQGREAARGVAHDDRLATVEQLRQRPIHESVEPGLIHLRGAKIRRHGGRMMGRQAQGIPGPVVTEVRRQGIVPKVDRGQDAMDKHHGRFVRAGQVFINGQISQAVPCDFN